MQTKDDFRFIIPYVEFAKEVKGRKPYVLDTSVVIDGRIADVVETQAFDNQLDHAAVRRSRSCRTSPTAPTACAAAAAAAGSTSSTACASNTQVELMIFDRELPEFAGQPVDLKLVLLAKHLNGKIVTNDYNLNKVAKLHGVDVINLNDVANALKPVFLVGETIEVRIVKPGEDAGPGRRLSRRRHDDRRRRGPRAHQPDRSRSASPACCKRAPAAWSSAATRGKFPSKPGREPFCLWRIPSYAS